jgi:formylglycine-generating enzyme required for sulfatase activity
VLFLCICAGASVVLRPQSQPSAPKTAAADFQPYQEIIPGSEVKFEMIPVAGGTYTMGSRPDEPGCSPDEGPQHQVTVAPFWIGKTEVTWDEYDIFGFSQDLTKKKRQKVDLSAQPATEKAADAVTRPTPPYADETFGLGREGQPVISITHHAAMEYCAWLSAKTGKSYRLPTEAEWEYACRAGAQTSYSFGNDASKLGEYAWFAENSEGKPQLVGKKKPNAWGLYDMHGNVAEWCLDRYGKSFYSSFKEKVPALYPVNLPGEEEYPHVVRGGCWDDPAPRLRSAARRSSSKEWNKRDPQIPQSIWWLTEAIHTGFRVVRPVNEQPNLRGFRSRTKAGQGTAEEK